MAKKRVLVFSDFDSVRAIIVRALENKGYEVFESKSYSEAIAHLNGTSYGIVITDNDVKNRDGIKIVEYMRDLTSYMYTPVMLLHSSIQDQLMAKHTELNIACYLGKPFDMQKFHTVVDRLA